MEVHYIEKAEFNQVMENYSLPHEDYYHEGELGKYYHHMDTEIGIIQGVSG